MPTWLSPVGWAENMRVLAGERWWVLLLLGGLGLALGYGKDIGPIVGACLVQAAAIWVFGGLAMLLHGVFPKAAAAAWGASRSPSAGSARR